MTSREFAEMSIRDAQIQLWAYGMALEDAGIASLESRQLVDLLLRFGAHEPGGVGITNENLARELGVSVKTMMRQRSRLMDEQKRSKVSVVTYESGRWEDGKPVPCHYYLHWNVLQKYAAKRLKQKYGAPSGA